MPRFQYSIRFLLLLTLIVAVLCSIGACTNWFVSVVLASTMLIGGVVGGIIARTKWGFVMGAAFGLQSFIFAFDGFIILLGSFPQALDFRHVIAIISGIAALIGGVLGGIVGGIFIRFLERLRSRRHTKP